MDNSASNFGELLPCKYIGTNRADLTAGKPSPTNVLRGVPVSFSAIIYNLGTGSTEKSFSNFFQVAGDPDDDGTITNLTSTQMNTLNGGDSRQSNSPAHVFAVKGIYYVRVCADKSSATDGGEIQESNENNNCGGWSQVSVDDNIVRVDGFCGTANKAYDVGSKSFGTDTFCTEGTVEPSILKFPTVSSPKTTWRCNGSNGGVNTICNAILLTKKFTLTVNSSVGGYIKSNDTPVTINCKSNQKCSYGYDPDTNVTIQAIPNSTYWKFSGWLGACSVSEFFCAIKMDGDKSATAVFTPRQFDYREF